MNYPTLYLMLDENVAIPSTEHIAALCDNQHVGVLNNGADVDGSFEHFSADYAGIIKEVRMFDDLSWSQNVIAIETTQIPTFLKLKYSNQIIAMYWVKDPKTSVDIQIKNSEAVGLSWLVSDLAAAIYQSVSEWAEQIGLDDDIDICSEAPDQALNNLLSPVWSHLQSSVASALLHNQNVCS